MMLHEVGHLLGLNDEYEDKACPDRTFISKDSNPYSIMDETNEKKKYLDFYPRHIKTIIQPLCPNTKLKVKKRTVKNI
jgi:hypothetical protein